MYEQEILTQCVERTQEDFPEIEVDIEVQESDEDETIFKVMCKQYFGTFTEFQYDCENLLNSVLKKLEVDLDNIDFQFETSSSGQARLLKLTSTISITHVPE